MKQLIAKDQRDLHAFLSGGATITIDYPCITIALLNSSGQETTYGGYAPMTFPFTPAFWNFKMKNDKLVLKFKNQVDFPKCVGNSDDVAQYTTELYGSNMNRSVTRSGINNSMMITEGDTVSFVQGQPQITIHRGNSTYDTIQRLFQND